MWRLSLILVPARMGSIPGGYMNQCYLTQKCTLEIPQKTKNQSMKNAVNLLPCTLMASLTSYWSTYFYSANFLEYELARVSKYIL